MFFLKLKKQNLLSALGMILLVFLMLLGLGCSSSDNDKESLSSGTQTGSGSAGGAPASVSVTASSNSISAFSGTTTIIVVVTDSSGRRAEGPVFMSSSLGGTLEPQSGLAAGGLFTTTFTATGGISGDTEITATVLGPTIIKGSTIVSLFF